MTSLARHGIFSAILLLAACPSALIASQVEVDQELESIITLFELVLEADPDTARQSLEILASKIQSGELSRETIAELRERLDEQLTGILQQPEHPLRLDAALVSASWRNPAAIDVARGMLKDPMQAPKQRQQALEALIAAGDPELLETVELLLGRDSAADLAFRGTIVNALGRMTEPHVAKILLDRFHELDEELRPKVVELLTQRASWSVPLLEAIGAQHIPRSALSVNQVRTLLSRNDPQLAELIAKYWGTIRTTRDERREQVVGRMAAVLHQTPGDPHRGAQVFQKLCGQCHKLYGTGEEVGPDITVNGRGSFEQLLSNVFDPSLVIGTAYQAHTVVTVDGRVLSGLLVEDSPGRVVLKLQGGKTETIPRDDIEETMLSPLSLMPEGIENQLTAEEIADLFAYLTLDRPPSDPDASVIAGTPARLHAGRSGN